jgi:hypothetical protein
MGVDVALAVEEMTGREQQLRHLEAAERARESGDEEDTVQ